MLGGHVLDGVASYVELAEVRGGTYSVGDLELLASTDVGGLGNGSLQSAESAPVKSLERTCQHIDSSFHTPYCKREAHPSLASPSYIRRPATHVPERW